VAETQSLLLKAGQTVATWNVRPTAVAICPDGATPVVDVSFQLKNPAAVVVITVGRLRDGRLAACTY
jgi:hypothetical protein